MATKKSLSVSQTVLILKERDKYYKHEGTIMRQDLDDKTRFLVNLSCGPWHWYFEDELERMEY